MSKTIELAAGQITRTDVLTIELVTPTDIPPAVLVRWPQAPSVLPPTPRALADLAAAVVRTLAQAQGRLAAIRQSKR
jgi:hypothetical protein